MAPSPGEGASGDPGAHPAARRAALLLGITLAQGLIGFVQYVTHLPEVLVGLHMAGATAVWLATLALVWSVRVRPPTRVTAAYARTVAAAPG